jgi:hypothetical protein
MNSPGRWARDNMLVKPHIWRKKGVPQIVACLDLTWAGGHAWSWSCHESRSSASMITDGRSSASPRDTEGSKPATGSYLPNSNNNRVVSHSIFYPWLLPPITNIFNFNFLKYNLYGISMKKTTTTLYVFYFILSTSIYFFSLYIRQWN